MEVTTGVLSKRNKSNFVADRLTDLPGKLWRTPGKYLCTNERSLTLKDTCTSVYSAVLCWRVSKIYGDFVTV